MAAIALFKKKNNNKIPALFVLIWHFHLQEKHPPNMELRDLVSSTVIGLAGSLV